MSYYLGQLDFSEYDSKKEINTAARKLRAEDKRRIDIIRADEKAFENRQLSIGEKRALVKQGTHRWCHKCRKRGYVIGHDGVMLKCAPCAGDGLIKNTKRRGRPAATRGPRPIRRARGSGRRRGGRTWSRPRPRRRLSRRVAANAAAAGALWAGLGDMLGTFGYLLAAVVIVLVATLKVLGAVTNGLANR